MAETLNFKQKRGDTFSLPIAFGQDITGWTVFLTLKKGIDDLDEAAVISKDVTIHTDASTGDTLVTMSATETSNLLGTYHYDIQYKDSSANIVTLVEGTIQFDKDVTRRTS